MVGKPACGNALTLLRAVNPAGPGAGWLFPCPCGTPWCARPCRGCPGGLAGSSPSGCCGSRRHRCREVGPGGDPAKLERPQSLCCILLPPPFTASQAQSRLYLPQGPAGDERLSWPFLALEEKPQPPSFPEL